MKGNLLGTIIFFLAGFPGVLAQGVTTASINGIIRDKKGEVLPGANVIAVHQPTGSHYGAAARVDGRFTIPNAKVGGPYKVTVSFVGFELRQEESGIRSKSAWIFSTPAIFSIPNGVSIRLITATT